MLDGEEVVVCWMVRGGSVCSVVCWMVSYGVLGGDVACKMVRTCWCVRW